MKNFNSMMEKCTFYNGLSIIDQIESHVIDTGNVCYNISVDDKEIIIHHQRYIETIPHVRTLLLSAARNVPPPGEIPILVIYRTSDTTDDQISIDLNDSVVTIDELGDKIIIHIYPRPLDMYADTTYYPFLDRFDVGHMVSTMEHPGPHIQIVCYPAEGVAPISLHYYQADNYVDGDIITSLMTTVNSTTRVINSGFKKDEVLLLNTTMNLFKTTGEPFVISDIKDDKMVIMPLLPSSTMPKQEIRIWDVLQHYRGTVPRDTIFIKDMHITFFKDGVHMTSSVITDKCITAVLQLMICAEGLNNLTEDEIKTIKAAAKFIYNEFKIGNDGALLCIITPNNMVIFDPSRIN